MLTTFINTLMSAEADAVCGAPFGQSSPDRTNVRNGTSLDLSRVWQGWPPVDGAKILIMGSVR